MTDKRKKPANDIVYLHGLVCNATIGVWEWEKQLKQKLVFDIELACDTAAAAKNDDLTQALDYQAITERVKKVVSSSAFELIESLAERVASTILTEFPTNWVRIKLDKGQAVAGVKNVGIVIERSSKPS